jgi:hypothetical protein
MGACNTSMNGNRESMLWFVPSNYDSITSIEVDSLNFILQEEYECSK